KIRQSFSFCQFGFKMRKFEMTMCINKTRTNDTTESFKLPGWNLSTVDCRLSTKNIHNSFIVRNHHYSVLYRWRRNRKNIIRSDRTIKNAFKLYDGNIVDGVLIPTASRMTACVSSQVGCSLTCSFCATGKLERLRNLNADEIYDQVAIIREQSMEHYNMPLSNIVFMGMGEPLLNYANVLKSIERITAMDGLQMAQRRVTVSTAGIAKMIKKLGDDEIKFNLALSLHAANDEKRNKIMPINEYNS